MVYNQQANVFVRLERVSETDKDKTCSNTTYGACKKPATWVAVLGNQRLLSCNNGGHKDDAECAVAQAFVDEMMDKYGNIPKSKM